MKTKRLELKIDQLIDPLKNQKILPYKAETPTSNYYSQRKTSQQVSMTTAMDQVILKHHKAAQK
jgi:hypothetical protein